MNLAPNRGDSATMLDSVLISAEFVSHEIALFAALGFLILGSSDLAVDLIWIGLTVKRRIFRSHAVDPEVVRVTARGHLAIFVPAWDEAAVIGGMLSFARTAFRDGNYRIYVGCYPNDPATLAVVGPLVDERIHVVLCQRPGPTSKADCLNQLWARMRFDEAAEGYRFQAIVLHDAEDVVHSAELAIFGALADRFDLVQLPVVPLIDPASRWVAGHYADEFAEAHGKELVVRQALGAALPSAGVGCAISRDALDRIAAAHGQPFDPGSLTEDYELGLRLRAMGGRGAFVRLRTGERRAVVATREFFPATFEAAVAQKSRWMAGIALAGWERLGWQGGLAERWMRLRDRQSVLAAIVLFAAYASLLLWSLFFVLELIAGRQMRPPSDLLAALLLLNSFLFAWRLAMRFGFVARAYGFGEGLRSIPRVLVGNIVAMRAARLAVIRYLVGRRTGTTIWGKTAHNFPVQLPAE
ncbi:glycosyl transferase family protein [Sphingosinicella sp. LHD-64]|uniref:glycosyl transferase family protein n=1 Tax=Sphingosinicella sp. LHD-64 TaxID=3072139 RepID=UPI00280E3F48|nr:glycosyl transferase family protein [Sphingosinicella sp. LHD-64]MDQ8756655.1 glycosyl transferase family protein [Sphingosinicella sp. LHD-64]